MKKEQVRNGSTLLEILVSLAIAAIIIALVASALSAIRQRSAATACANNLRNIALGMQAYHAQHGRFPPGVTIGIDKPDPHQYMSWMARLLPHIEQNHLWEEALEAYRLEPSYNRNPPHRGLATPVKLYACPADTRAGQVGLVFHYQKPHAFTSYLGVMGLNERRRNGVLFANSRINSADIHDGLGNTLMIGERPPSADLSLGWWYAAHGQGNNGDADLVLGVRARCYSHHASECPWGPYEFTPGRFSNQCDAFHFWSPHPGGAHFAFADGSVRFLHYSANDILPALATRAGGESVQVP